MAAAFTAIVPSYISRSVGGSYDNEGVAIFALIFVFYLWIKSVHTGFSFPIIHLKENIYHLSHSYNPYSLISLYHFIRIHFLFLFDSLGLLLHGGSLGGICVHH